LKSTWTTRGKAVVTPVSGESVGINLVWEDGGLCGWLDRRVKNVRAHGRSLGLEIRAESARNPTVAKIASRADRGVRELLSRVVREGQERGQVDPGLDPDIVAAVVHSIIFGLNRLGAVRDPKFDVKAASAMLKLLMERFLRPQATSAAKQVRHPEREENGRKLPP
jgi:BetI-type transcriptional repressor, C-terminal